MRNCSHVSFLSPRRVSGENCLWLMPTWDEAGCLGCLCAIWAGSLKASSGLGWNGESHCTENSRICTCALQHFYLRTLYLTKRTCLHFQLFPDQCSWPQREDALQHQHMRSQMDFRFLFLKDFNFTA